MSVKELRGFIDAATTQLHEASLAYKRMPERFKYLETSQLALKISQLHIQLQALQIEARQVHRQVLIREGKNPNIAAP